MTPATVSTTADLENLPRFREGWKSCREGLLQFLTERLLARAKGADPGATREIANLIDDLRSIGFTADSSNEKPEPIMRPLHSFDEEHLPET